MTMSEDPTLRPLESGETASPQPPAAPAAAPAPQARRSELALWALLALAISGLLGYAVIDRFERARTPELPLMAELPEYRFVNRDGREVGSSDFAGKPYLADFIFTHCPSACPILSRRMSELARELPLDRLNLVSFSVDPENDSPSVLEAYAGELGAPPQWFFLTGEKDKLFLLIRQGFQLAVDDSPQIQVTDPIVHSNRFVLVDAQGRIRGYYNAMSEEELARLRIDLDRLLKR